MMLSRLVSAFVLSAVFSQPLRAEEPLKNAVDSTCRPTFQTAAGPLSAGTAFVLASPGKGRLALLVTAHHLFGPAGGMERQLSWKELPSSVAGAQCLPLASGASAIKAGRALAVRNAHSDPDSGNGFPRDMAMLPLAAMPKRALTLSASEPKPGDTVWLVASVQPANGRQGHQAFLHKALVTQADRTMIRFLYDNSSLQLRATSGAPIINSAGEVVGINYGGGQSSSGMVGLAVGRGVIAEGLAGLP